MENFIKELKDMTLDELFKIVDELTEGVDNLLGDEDEKL